MPRGSLLGGQIRRELTGEVGRWWVFSSGGGRWWQLEQEVTDDKGVDVAELRAHVVLLKVVVGPEVHEQRQLANNTILQIRSTY
jgi:hypothetical protein